MLTLKRTKLVAVMIAVLLALPFASLTAMADNATDGPGTTTQGTGAPVSEGTDTLPVSDGQEPTTLPNGDNEPETPPSAPKEAPKPSGNNTNDAAPDAPKAQEFKVTFINYDGDEFYFVMVEQGKSVAAPIFAPMLDGHVFLGWRDVTTLIEDEWFDFLHTPVGGELTIVAVYEGVHSISLEPTMTEEEPGEGASGEGASGEGEESSEDGNEVPSDLLDGHSVLGVREETLGGQSILIIDDEEGSDESGVDGMSEFDDEEEDVPLAGPTALISPLEGLQVQIFSNHSECVQEGSTLAVWAELSDNSRISELAFQWQSSEDGVNWVNVEGANSLRYEFSATNETVNLSWRIGVSVVPVAVAPVVVAENPVPPVI